MQLVSPVRNEVAATTAARYYSLRRLSPYQGTVQVIEMPGFRAMSADGTTWELRFENPGARPTRTVWHEGGAYDVELSEHTEPFLTAVRDHPRLPFALADTLELWLLDARDALPLALLASALPHMAPPSTVETIWRAAFNGDDSFVATSLQTAATHPPESPFIPHREILNRCVYRAASARAQAQWFRRDMGGEGVGLHGSGIPDKQVGRTLEPSRFPELLLREFWDSDVEVGLVRDYHDWLAPTLLTHSGLRRATRDRLERAACRQAEKLYRVRQLLPDVINSDLMDVALVEALLRRSNSPTR